MERRKEIVHFVYVGTLVIALRTRITAAPKDLEPYRPVLYSVFMFRVPPSERYRALDIPHQVLV